MKSIADAVLLDESYDGSGKEFLLIVQYNAEDIKDAHENDMKLDDWIYTQYNVGFDYCNHSHDCCGCYGQFVRSIKHIKKGYKAVIVQSIQNV